MSPLEALQIAALRLAMVSKAGGKASAATAEIDQISTDWNTWVRALFSLYTSSPDTHEPIPFSQRHIDLWEWAWAIQKGQRPPPFIAIWPRGGAKSTSAEMAAVCMAARKTRRYALYICESQDQADDHVGNIGAMLESKAIGHYYPQLAARAVGKFGNSKGWRRNRLRAANGFTLDAIGLDTAARGAKVDEDRPDLMIIDDIDGELDSPGTTNKKIKTLTSKLLPAGSNDLAVMAVQNLVLETGVFARLADGTADFLADRIVSGPHPAVEGLAYEQREGKWEIVGGQATWQGQNLEKCQAMVNSWGLSAFLREAQHEVGAPAGGVYSHLEFQHCSWDQVPELIKCVLWVDPAVTETDNSDSYGIQADGLGEDGKIYRLYSWEDRTSPGDVMERAILKAIDLHADRVGFECDQGGDTWKTIYEASWKSMVAEGKIHADTFKPRFASARAGAGHGPKVYRAQQQVSDYEKGRFVHVLGTSHVLERALFRFPATKPLDLADASYWSWNDLRHGIVVPNQAPISLVKPSLWRIA